VQTLQTYPFPGNVRELENVLERALTLSTGGVITAEHIACAATRLPPRPRRPRRRARPRQHRAGSQLESIEARRHYQGTRKDPLQQDGGGEAPGMSFRALRYRIKKLGIE